MSNYRLSQILGLILSRAGWKVEFSSLFERNYSIRGCLDLIVHLRAKSLASFFIDLLVAKLYIPPVIIEE